MLLYKLSQNKDPGVDYNDNDLAWGLLTLSLTYVPGLYKTARLARRMKWGQMSAGRVVSNGLLLIVLAIVWPVYSILL